ncbi:hypothetical protein Lal_00012108 [Lupinus albus]|nr:hypothetical protein Lal_00012108 [Lupinus albus]
MEHFGPGPSNPSLLRLQQNHVSKYVWDSEEITFRARCNFWQTLPHERVLQFICNTTFSPILEMGSIEINNHLLTALVERWRPDTHTFHFPNRECTITLEDVAYQLGLPIDGKTITGDTTMDWEDLCIQLLGVAPTDRQINGWGSSVLACLYRGLCRAVSQHLITTNILGHTTNIIRGMLVRLRVDQFVWTPYTSMNIMGQILNICRACVPLISFATVEWHAADRVMRQFGMQQTIPQDPPNFDKLHKMDLRGKHEYNWPQKHEFNFAYELMERTIPPQAYNNPIQTINYVHLACKELVRVLT